MHPTHDTDEQLLRRFAEEGDREAAGRLIERYQSPIYDLCFRILRHEADAADATQATLLNALRAARKFRGRSTLRTWIYRIGMNEATKLQTRTWRKTAMERPIDAETTSPDSGDPRRAEMLATLEREVEALPEAFRRAVVLHYGHGLAYEEAARVLGCAAGTVGSRLATARDRLRARLQLLGANALVPDLEGSLRATRSVEAPQSLRSALSLLPSTTVPAAAVPLAVWAGAAAVVLGATGVLAFGSLASDRGTAETPAVTAGAERGTGEGGSGGPVELASVEAPVQPRRAEGAALAPPTTGVGAEIAFRVAGTVLHRESGQPIAGATVALDRIFGERGPSATPPKPRVEKSRTANTATTDAEGRYEIVEHLRGPAVLRVSVEPGFDYGLSAPGRVLVATKSETVAADFSAGPSSSAQHSALQEPSRRETVAALRSVFELAGVTHVTGVLQCEDRSALGTVVLRAFDAMRETLAEGTLVSLDSSTGDFVVGPVPEAVLRLEAAGGPQGFAIADGIVPTAGRATEGIVLTLRAGGERLEGTVVDAEGRPLPGASIKVYPESLTEGGWWFPPAAEGTSDAKGRFDLARLGTTSDLFRVVVELHPRMPVTLRSVLGGTAGLRVALLEPPRIRGRIVLRESGSPPSFCMIIADLAEEPETGGSYRAQRASSGGSAYETRTGLFVRVLERPGTVTLQIEVPGHAPFVRKDLVVGPEGIDLGTIEIE